MLNLKKRTFHILITFEKWCKLPTGKRTVTAELPKRKFHKEERNSNEYQHDNIWDEESTASITEAQVREPPDITLNKEYHD